MQQAGVMNSKDGNRFDPKGTAIRAQVTAVLHRYVELVIDSATTKGWTKNDSGHWYYYKEGKKLTDRQTIDSQRHYFKGDGVMHEGWKQDTNKKWYYWTNSRAVTGWREIDGKWYYFYTDGSMRSARKLMAMR